MEFQKIANFLDTTSDDKDLPRFVTKNRLNFMINQEEIRIKTLMLRSDLCEFNDAYVVVKRDITVGARNNA